MTSSTPSASRAATRVRSSRTETPPEAVMGRPASRAMVSMPGRLGPLRVPSRRTWVYWMRAAALGRHTHRLRRQPRRLLDHAGIGDGGGAEDDPVGPAIAITHGDLEH